jgi:hypothetical protein
MFAGLGNGSIGLFEKKPGKKTRWPYFSATAAETHIWSVSRVLVSALLAHYLICRARILIGDEIKVLSASIDGQLKLSDYENHTLNNLSSHTLDIKINAFDYVVCDDSIVAFVGGTAKTMTETVPDLQCITIPCTQRL